MGTNKISRRDTLKALATLPVLGYFSSRFYVKYKNELGVSDLNRMQLNIGNSTVEIPSTTYTSEGPLIRLGIVGNGFRGPQVLRAFGFASREWATDKMENG